MNSLQAQNYLDRIGFSAQPEPTLTTLAQLQLAHLFTVPFENLDIHRGVPITIDFERIFNKVVTNQRGGFCYELNSLFGELLRHLGFNVMHLSAQVYAEPTGFGLRFSHLTLGVCIENTVYLSDVGFGEFSFAPLKLTPGNRQQDQRGLFCVDYDADKRCVVSKHEDGVTRPEYAFYQKHRELKEFESMCHYHQTSPDSSFTKKRLISRPTPEGRITISGNMLTIKTGAKTDETALQSEADFIAALAAHFEVELQG